MSYIVYIFKKSFKKLLFLSKVYIVYKDLFERNCECELTKI